METLTQWHSVKANKEHNCPECPTVIAKGQVYKKASFADGGRAHTVKLCYSCYKLMCEAYSNKTFQDEWYEGDIAEYRRENQNAT